MRLRVFLLSWIVVAGALANDKHMHHDEFGSERQRSEYRQFLLSGRFGRANPLDRPAPEDPKLRYEAMRQTALALGAQGALYVESGRIRQYLDSRTDLLDRSFDFGQMMLTDPSGRSIRPPVIVDSGSSAKVDESETMLRVASVSYLITRPAGFVLQPPNWREYLYRYEPKPELPPRTLMPRSEEEESYWTEWFNRGWEAGEHQARRIFQLNVNQMTRDYIGMVRYHLMRQQGYVTDPVVETAYHAVTGGADKMAIEDVLLTIKVRPGLNVDTTDWKPVPRLPDVKWLNVPYHVERPDLDGRISVSGHRGGVMP